MKPRWKYAFNGDKLSYADYLEKKHPEISKFFGLNMTTSGMQLQRG